MGKAFDTFAPIGPEITLLSENNLAARLQELGIRCLLNGQVVQNSNTKHMIFSCAEIVSYLSQVMTLQPGDLIFTGTPPGVGFGRSPQLFMKPTDVARCEIDVLGAISNTVVLDSAVAASASQQ